MNASLVWHSIFIQLASGLYLGYLIQKGLSVLFYTSYFLFSWLVINWIKSVLEWRAIRERMTLRQCFTAVCVFGDDEIQGKTLTGISDFNFNAFV